ncbi:MAG: hypothetical protein COA86_04255 [Kangiella sp.]|nr:MAG: hypothetical protein COA86_04255 [Kangiella sp.]
MTLKFQIADWTVDPQQCLLVKTSANNRLEPKAMALLVVLAEAEGELVSRQKIFEAVWPNQHVSDYALNTLIASLRKSLGSHSGNASLIETRPKLGYRLSSPVIWLSADKAYSLDKTESESSETKQVKTNNKILFNLLTKPSNRILVLMVILFVVFSVEYLMFDVAQSQKIVANNKRALNSIAKNKVIKYTVKVALSYSMIEKDKNGKPYCSDFSFEMLSKAIYDKGHWKLVGNTVTFQFNHQGVSFTNISETHTVEYINFIGKKEIDETTMTLDAVGELSGISLMEVFDEDNNLICKGKSLFIGTKI